MYGFAPYKYFLLADYFTERYVKSMAAVAD